MPRRLRIHVPGGFYHATLRGNHQQNIFVADGDFYLLNKLVARAIEKFGAHLHAYCWMSNHLHLLVQVGDVPLANPMRQIAAEFARAMQSKIATTGHYFERRYHAVLVDSDAYLLELIRYIHLNPVRAGMVSNTAAYPWSSHHAYAGNRTEPWVTTDFALKMFASSRECAIAAYLDFVSAGGDERVVEKIVTGFQIAPASRGEPAVARPTPSALASRQRQDLAGLISEACLRFVVDADELATPTS